MPSRLPFYRGCPCVAHLIPQTACQLQHHSAYPTPIAHSPLRASPPESCLAPGVCAPIHHNTIDARSNYEITRAGLPSPHSPPLRTIEDARILSLSKGTRPRKVCLSAQHPRRAPRPPVSPTRARPLCSPPRIAASVPAHHDTVGSRFQPSTGARRSPPETAGLVRARLRTARAGADYARSYRHE